MIAKAGLGARVILEVKTSLNSGFKKLGFREPSFKKPKVIEPSILAGLLSFTIVLFFYVIAPLGAESLSSSLKVTKPHKRFF